MFASTNGVHPRALPLGLFVVIFFVVVIKAEGQVTATPTFSVASATPAPLLTVTITDATPGASIYYATGGRTPTTNSIQYTGPLTVRPPISIEAIAVAPGYSSSAVASASYTNMFGTATTLSSSANPAVLGEAITFLATVTPTGSTTTPTGAVQFSVNGTAMGSPVQLDGNGDATYTISTLPIGYYLNIAAAYQPGSGAPFFASSAPLVQGVYAAQPESQYALFNDAVRTLGSGFNHPYGIAVDGNDNVFVADTNNHAVKEIAAAGGYATVSTLQNGGSGYYPTGIAVDKNGNLFVTDAGNYTLSEIPASGGYSTVNPLGGGFNWPYGVAVDGNENVYVADLGSNTVKQILASSGYTSVNVIGGSMVQPWGVALDANGNLFVSDVDSKMVLEILANGGYTTINTLGDGYFADSYGIAVDFNGNVYVADAGYDSIREISSSDGFTTVCTPGSGLNTPIGVAVDGAGNIFVADTDNNAVKEISRTGGNFGSVKVGTTSPIPISMSFIFEEAITLGSTAVLTQDLPNLDFTDTGDGTCMSGTPYSAGATCTVIVNFTPSQAGVRTGSVILFDGLGNPLARGFIQGTGTP